MVIFILYGLSKICLYKRLVTRLRFEQSIPPPSSSVERPLYTSWLGEIVLQVLFIRPSSVFGYVV
jgi:hypothetical protein